MKFLPFLFIAFFSLTISHCCAQVPVLIWQKCLGGGYGDYASSVRPTTDGGYVVAGYVGNGGGDVMGYHGNPDINDLWIVKLNSTGDIMWQKCLGGTYLETGADIHQTPDGGYIVAGSSSSVDCSITGNHGGLDYWIVKLSAAGDIIWQKMLGGSKNEYCYSIDLTSDGGYIAAGLTESSDGDITTNKGSRDYWIVKIDGAGNLKWQKSLGGSKDDAATSVRATKDGGCVVAGTTESSDGDVTKNNGKRDYWIVKLGDGGTLQWEKSFGGANFDEAWSIQLTPDGGYIVNGYSSSNDGDVSGNHHALGQFSDYWVIKLGSSGGLDWQKCYGGTFNEIGYYVQVTPDGGYVLAGSAESNNADASCNKGITDMWIVKISNNGAVEWQKSLGGNYYDQALSVQPLNDGTFIVGGTTCSTDNPAYHANTSSTCGDYWVVKLSAPVLTPPNPLVTIEPASGNVCIGSNATFTATALYAGIIPTYRWEKNGITVGINSPSYSAADFKDKDVLACYVTTDAGCDGTILQSADTIIIKPVNNPLQPQITISGSNAVCNCTLNTFTATVLNQGTSPAFQWKVNDDITGAVKNFYTSNTLKTGDVITCIYTDNSGCITNGSVVSNAITMNAGAMVVPTVTITSSVAALCQGSTVTFTATPVNAGNIPSFHWKINGANAGTNGVSFTTSNLKDGDTVNCTITVDSVFACSTVSNAVSNNIVVKITGKTSPSAVVKASTDSICTGAAVTFTAIASNAGTTPSWQWKINGKNAGTSRADFTTSTLTNGDIVTCVVGIDPLFTCSASATANSNEIEMKVNDQLSASATISASGNNVCAGSLITFTVKAENAGTGPLYQWIWNSAPVSDNSPVFSGSSFSNGDSLFCLVTPGTGSCSTTPVSSNIIVTTINYPPAVNISPKDTTVRTGDQFQFRVVLGNNVRSWYWAPADKLEDPLSLNPVTVHLSDNTTFILTAQTDMGCQSQVTAVVKVGMPLIMPGAFTPNGDGVNDVFRIPPAVLLTLEEFSILTAGEKEFL